MLIYVDDHAPLASILDYHRSTRLLPEGNSPATARWELSVNIKRRSCKYVNNIIEADHAALKQAIRPARVFQTMKAAAATIKGFEVMRMIRRGRCFTCKSHAKEQVRFLDKLLDIFDVAPWAKIAANQLRPVK